MRARRKVAGCMSGTVMLACVETGGCRRWMLVRVGAGGCKRCWSAWELEVVEDDGRLKEVCFFMEEMCSVL
jgi:hypothetical protein